MEKETQILNSVYERFPALADAGRIPGVRRIDLTAPEDIFHDVMVYLKDEWGFDYLSTVSGVDAGDALEAIYHIAEPGGIVVNLRIRVSREDPKMKTACNIYNGAIFYERELEGTLGFQIEGLPAGRQYPLPDDWPKDQYPLRKDWKPDTTNQNC